MFGASPTNGAHDVDSFRGSAHRADGVVASGILDGVFRRILVRKVGELDGTNDVLVGGLWLPSDGIRRGNAASRITAL